MIRTTSRSMRPRSGLRTSGMRLSMNDNNKIWLLIAVWIVFIAVITIGVLKHG